MQTGKNRPGTDSIRFVLPMSRLGVWIINGGARRTHRRLQHTGISERRQGAKVDPLRWHDLRHTWASWAVQSGVTLHELMLLGGWRSFPMVLRYAHFAPDHLALAAAKVRLNRRTKTGTLKNVDFRKREEA
jgi:integrase